MPDAVVISCSDHYGHRMKYWDVALQRLGMHPVYVTTDFLHVEKQTYTCSVPGCVQIHVPPYRKNLSISRILSHRSFARSVFRYLERERPRVVVSLLPPNYLAKYLARYKGRHPETKLIFDIFDLWPETFPSSRVKRLLAPVFRVWAGLRDRHLPVADYVTAECDLFRERLGLSDERSETVYFSLDPYASDGPSPEPVRDRAHIAYLGSINNIIDIPRIVDVLSELNRRIPTVLHVIGAGERCEEFCDSVRASGVSVEYHGAIFDEDEKHRILSLCHFGLNVMKPSVCVGLTMKSVDYFRHGLPVINSIPADTWSFVEKNGVGVNLTEPALAAEQAARAIASDVSPMKRAARCLFTEQFSSEHNVDRCELILRRAAEL